MSTPLTQATGIDVTSECPAGHGRVTCWSAYGGPDLDFAAADLRPTAGVPPACVLYVDTYLGGLSEDMPEVLGIWQALRPFLEGDDYPKVWRCLVGTAPARCGCMLLRCAYLSRCCAMGQQQLWAPAVRGPASACELISGIQLWCADVLQRISAKLASAARLASCYMRRRLVALQVWHNYGFDRHILQRRRLGLSPADLAAAGIAEDSLASDDLTLRMGGFAGDTLHLARLHDAARTGAQNYSLSSLSSDDGVMVRGTGLAGERAKVSMKELFARPKLMKSGKPSASLKELPPIHEIQVRLRGAPACSAAYVDALAVLHMPHRLPAAPAERACMLCLPRVPAFTTGQRFYYLVWQPSRS